MRSFTPESLSIKERHGLLLGAIGPRPIAWVSSMDKEGNPNLAPFSFFNIFSSNPPILIFSPARSGRTKKLKHTFNNVCEHPEAVINIVDHSLLDRMVISSLEYEQGVNEFEKAGLTMLPSTRVQPMRIAESPVQLECKVLETKVLGNEGAAGNLVICEVVQIHIAERILTADGLIDQEKIDLIGRLGGAWYTRANGDSLFEVKSNPMNIVVGYDQIPEFARYSEELNAQEISQLAQHDQIPNETEVNDFKLEELSEIFVDQQDEPEQLQSSLIQKTKTALSDNDLDKAWKTLLSYNP